MKVLEKNGIQIKFEGAAYMFLGTLTMMVADNLAAHAIGGNYCNFSTVKRFCRFCTFMKSRLNEIVLCDNLDMRTVEGYNNNVADVRIDPTLGPVYGLQTDSCLNELTYYHVINGLPPDIAHDVFEGVARDLVTGTIVKFVKLGLFTLTEFNDRITSFCYSELDKRNQPQPVNIKPLTKLKVKQTACEMWNLLRLLPLMIGDLVPNDNECWLLFCKFVDIVDRMCATSFNDAELTVLKLLLDEFFPFFHEVFPDVSIKPKAHFLRHYPLMIKKFGPLIKTLRFEAKNGYLKSGVSITKNRKNVCQTMAKRHQMSMYLSYKNDTILEGKAPKGIFVEEVLIESLIPSVYGIIATKVPLHSLNMLTRSKAVILNGQRYSHNEAVVVSFHLDEFVFGLIESVYFVNEEIYLLCNDLLIESYSCHYRAYEVLKTGTLTFLNIRELLDYHPLGVYYLSGKTYITLKYYISEELLS